MPVIDLILNILQTLTALVLAAFTWRMIVQKKDGTPILAPALFAFALITLVMSNLYWLAYSILRPDTRMPFSASEIGECGVLLLLTASLSASLPKEGKRFGPRSLIIFLSTLCFASCNTALWIGWNGSHVTDILSGLSLWALSIVCLYALVRTKALSTLELIGLGVWAFLLTALQGMTFFVPENVRTALDTVCYILIIAGHLLFIVKIILCFCKRAPAQRLLALTYTWQCMSLVTLYMSADIMYNIVFLFLTAALVFIFFALRRSVKEKEVPAV